MINFRRVSRTNHKMTILTLICENLLRSCDIDELGLSLLLVLVITEVVWMPLLSELSVGLRDLSLVRIPAREQLLLSSRF